MRKIRLIIAVAMAASVLTSCTTIDSGSVGIKFKRYSSNSSEQGGVVGTCKGFVWYNPFAQSVYEYPIFTQRKGYSKRW